MQSSQPAVSAAAPPAASANDSSNGSTGAPRQNGAPREEPKTTKYDYPAKQNVVFADVQRGLKSHWTRNPRFWITSVIFSVIAVVTYGFLNFRNHPEVIEVEQDVLAFYRKNPLHFYYASGAIAIATAVAVWLTTVYMLVKSRAVYLVDFAVASCPDECKVDFDTFSKKSRATGFFGEEAMVFQEKVFQRTGVGPEAYFAPGILKSPPVTSMEEAREESRMVLFPVVEELLKRSGLRATDIDILIVNCSLFNPTPSLCAMIINKFKMRSDVKAFNLSGMGCSAGLISIDLAKDLLQVHRNAVAIVCSTENVTQNWYRGNDKTMLVSNTLFRMGGAAIMLTNRADLIPISKYRLQCTVRVHKGADDKAYHSVYQLEDAQGRCGVRLVPAKELMEVVGDALKTNMTILGPMVLPYSEQIKFIFNLVRRKYLGQKVPTYIPDFRKAFNHYCIHAGGRAIIDGLEQNLKLSPQMVEPSRATLYRYGNTSSSSIWYELAFIERKGSMKKGDKVWQIAVGSGFKCNSAVWKCIRNFEIPA